MEPSDLARHLGIDPKKLRAWLRRTYPRSLVDHNSRWSLTPEQVAAALSHFSGDRASSSALGVASPRRGTSPGSPPAAAEARLWAHMDAQPGHKVASFSAASAPTTPGVYAFYRDGAAVYVGRAVTSSGLRGRLRTHTASGIDLSHSSFRRNVAALLDVAPTAVTRMRPPQLTAEQVAPVNEWIAGCIVRWVEAASVEAAKQLENDMKAEWKPPLTKR